MLVISLIIRNIFCEKQSQIFEIITLNVVDYIFYDVVDYVFYDKLKNKPSSFEKKNPLRVTFNFKINLI